MVRTADIGLGSFHGLIRYEHLEWKLHVQRQCIAPDMGCMCVSYNGLENLGLSSLEPEASFQHPFRVCDGLSFADLPPV